ncbi:MAG: hypothetical protein L3K26_19640 [Candidatus Hydrogenedentes bacterium]|nr:hypothetical protein [Candidatus Hydrogenedentota bacterium]
MNFWMGLWKWLMILSVGSFSIMAVWVTIQGARDIKSLLRTLREGHETSEENVEE